MTKNAVVGGYYRMCKPSKWAAAQELLIQIEKRGIAERILMTAKQVRIWDLGVFIGNHKE